MLSIVAGGIIKGSIGHNINYSVRGVLIKEAAEAVSRRVVVSGSVETATTNVGNKNN